jgi:hypothetical protein
MDWLFGGMGVLKGQTLRHAQQSKVAKPNGGSTSGDGIRMEDMSEFDSHAF